MEEAGRNWHGDVLGDLGMAEHCLDYCATSSAVPVREGVDGLKLCVRDRRLGERRDVQSRDECDQIIHCPRDTLVMRRNEAGEVRTEGAPANPYLLVAPSTGELWGERSEKGSLHFDDALPVDIVGEGECGFHRANIAHDLCGVSGFSFSEFGFGDGLGTAREVFDLGR